MLFAVMNNSLNSIMLVLKNSVDSSQNVTDIGAVSNAVTQLEHFPMTMGQLQDTRIGQLLQSIRHKVDPVLQKRIRSVIKAWQKLLAPDCSHLYVIPIKTTNKDLSSSKSNGTPNKVDLCEKPKQTLNTINSTHSSQSSSPSLKPTESSHLRPAKRIISVSSAPVSDIPINNLHSVDSNTGINHVTTPPKKMKMGSSTSHSPLSMTPDNQMLMNGNKYPQPQTPLSSIVGSRAVPKLNSSTPLSNSSGVSDSTSHISLPKFGSCNLPRLSKVKSTAELVQAAGDCIDSVTADRILTNRISKEVELPRTPVAQSMKPRNRVAASHHNTARSALIHKEMNSAVKINTASTPEAKPLDSTLLKDSRIPSLNTSLLPESKSCLSSKTINSPSLASNAVDSPFQFKSKVDNFDSASDIYKFKKKKKKHKHHKHRTESADVTSDPHPKQFSSTPPVTNHLEDWPELPPMPDFIDWQSLDRNCFFCDSVSKNCEKCSSGISSNNHTQTIDEFISNELFSITLDDQYLHILPWVDMFGYKRQFFPSSTSQELDRLTELPEPW